MSSESGAPFPPATLRPLLTEISALLAKPGDPLAGPISLAVAETTSGGLISAALLSVPGASKWYAGGATLYTKKSRELWAGWGAKDLDNYKGPTEEVVAGLASHVRSTLDATYCIGESGTAGPTARVHLVPGRVALAIASKSGPVITRTVDTGLGNDREANMVAFAEHALRLLRDVLTGEEAGKTGAEEGKSDDPSHP